MNETARDVMLTWRGHTGTMDGWTGPDTIDGGSHLAFQGYDPEIRCPCGWSHHVVGDEVRSWGLTLPEQSLRRRTGPP